MSTLPASDLLSQSTPPPSEVREAGRHSREQEKGPHQGKTTPGENGAKQNRISHCVFHRQLCWGESISRSFLVLLPGCLRVCMYVTSTPLSGQEEHPPPPPDFMAGKKLKVSRLCKTVVRRGRERDCKPL